MSASPPSVAGSASGRDDQGAGSPIAYLTDVEGLWPKLLGFLEANPLVSLDPKGRLRVADGAVFVFGGDAIDRGPDARRIVKLLVEAKQRQPGQVVLLAGNRDINKLRLPRELGGLPPLRTPAEIRGASRGALLRWIFDNTMGASMAFANRRAELASEGRDHGDDEVVQSYLEDLGAEGDLRSYLASCQLAFRAGPTLFVHGGVTEQNFGRVPGREGLVEGVDAWVACLNRWYSAQIDAFLHDEHDAAGNPAWAPLIAYQAPLAGTRCNQGSVVYARPTDDEGNPCLPEPSLVEALQCSGIARVVVGHTPIGDSPSLLREPSFELLAADNSYSPVESGARLYICGDEVRSEALTRLPHSDAPEPVRFCTRLGDLDALVGLRLEETGHLIKGELASGDYLLHRSLPGWRVDQRVMGPRELRASRLVLPRR